LQDYKLVGRRPESEVFRGFFWHFAILYSYIDSNCRSLFMSKCSFKWLFRCHWRLI